MPYYKTRCNKVGIPAEVKTCRVPAAYFSRRNLDRHNRRREARQKPLTIL